MNIKQTAVSGVGIDITEVSRVKQLYGKNPAFLKRFFTPGEAAYCLKGKNIYERIAARFSAKEAVIKALDRKDLPFRSISILKAETGRPLVSIKGLKGISVMLSISHTEHYACACAVALRSINS
ncbi:MAG: holo-[acyl-carrier-protein] synthase [Elusimicrobia bacterium GWC2_51_8]|nr:MAG: holo-[acyl-carrier-protein] synthase [Elusimicrobia bacterium GWA2_51_34]OGR65208.1 MAG: holo-[acyl-carrier-protein] synthase [Elusimicrobia bacterium GWC2_51_8]OGR86028.1 MAG: holo-[acyl-carrier-protein] synthase [Elusimicrobia bacterium GWF2_52_66]HAF95630.1 holo-[acyl-carrier-protein] synthase [Elusimicrobiota bacterium]HCE98320.1 holo-[acyl-carrier-protein] synthase [Elusimicrobiota bacterium]